MCTYICCKYGFEKSNIIESMKVLACIWKRTLINALILYILGANTTMSTDYARKRENTMYPPSLHEIVQTQCVYRFVHFVIEIHKYNTFAFGSNVNTTHLIHVSMIFTKQSSPCSVKVFSTYKLLSILINIFVITLNVHL